MVGANIVLFLLVAVASPTPILLDATHPLPEEGTALLDAVDYRLPATVKPLRYYVRLVPHIEEGDFTFSGSVLISIQVLEATSTIVLHKNHITVDENAIVVRDLFSDEEVAVVNVTWDEATHFYTIGLAVMLKIGRQYSIHIGRFQGILDSDMHGFYRSYYIEDGQTRWLAATQLEATAARRAFPCFDEPALKAHIRLSVSRPAALRALSNMPQAGTPEKDNENTDVVRYWDHFQDTPLMSTYLLAILVSDFVYLENAAESHRVYSQPLMISQARYSLSVSRPILSWLANFTGISFHLPKMDEAAIPDFEVGAEENWGLVTYREHRVLFDEDASPSSSRQSVATTIAHEFAHQWFGDLVSPRWWSFTWLNEGFATYFEFHTYIDPTWRLEEQFVAIKVHEAMALDSSQNSHPMTINVASPASIDSIFDGISYAKSGSVLRMLKHIISPETFQRGIQRYLLDRSYQSAEADDLFEMMNSQLHEDVPEAADVDVKRVMDTWTLQMGYPVVTVTRNYTTDAAELVQQRFILDWIEEHPDTHSYKWHIPLTYTTQIESNFEVTSPKVWFYAEQDTKQIEGLPSDAHWILFNIVQTGFYRVNYDDKNWALLTGHLDSNQYADIHVLNRGQLIDDSFNLARAGLTSYDTPLAITKYLRRELDYVAWYSAFVALSHLDARLMDRDDYSLFQAYVLSLMHALFSAVGLDPAAGDDHVTRLNRAAAVRWACTLGEASCVQRATADFARWRAAPQNNPISADLKSSVYCSALRFGGQTDWDFLWQQYVNTHVATEAVVILGALGCATDTDILLNYMTMAVTENSLIRKQDCITAFSSVINNPVGVNLALYFVLENYEKIAAYDGGMGLIGSLMMNIANRCNYQMQSNLMSGFLMENFLELGPAVNSILRATAIVDENVAWKKSYEQQVMDWIRNNPIS